MGLRIVKGDIRESSCQAIVNAANTDLLMGGGVCGAIYNAAGVDELKDFLAGKGPVATAEPVLSPGFDLEADYIIHVAGPIYDPNKREESQRLLKAAYTNTLDLAKENGISSIAFPLISAGIYGYPKEEALDIARETIGEFLKENPMDVDLIIYDK